jgi:hypothetical protein
MPGLPRQRNAIMARSDGYDALVFFDDDFFPATDYLANAEDLLLRERDVVVVTGKLIEDGIHGPGLTAEYAGARLAD